LVKAPGRQRAVTTDLDLDLGLDLADSHLLAHELRRRVAALRVVGEAIAVLREQGADLSTMVARLGAELNDLDELTREVLGQRRDGGAADAVAALRMAAKTITAARKARVAVTAPTTPLWVSANPAMLRQAIENLLDNAVTHGGRNQASVRVQANQQRAEVEILVADYGRGRGGGKLPDHGGGYGIGLLLERRLLDSSGGRSLVRERRGGGTVVSITLPLAARPGSSTATSG